MCANTLDLKNATLEEIEAIPDPDFVPEGWLDPPAAAKEEQRLGRENIQCLGAGARPVDAS